MILSLMTVKKSPNIMSTQTYELPLRSLIPAGSSDGPLEDQNREVIGLNTLISKMPGDDTNSSDRGITLRLQYVSQLLVGKGDKR
jgi:hypothetical protein